jgi:hypothetical protein
MPQPKPAPIVSFQVPMVSDSFQNTDYKTVHVVVLKPRTKSDEGGFEVIVGPMIIVFLIAVTIVVVLLKIKPGSKTNRILNRLEGSAGIIDGKVASGDI